MDDVIETANIIPESSMSAFVKMVVRYFENPENRKKFEEWQRTKTTNPALSTITGEGGESIE